MAKTAIDAKRGNVFMLEPERLTLVTDKNHPLYDPRVEDEPSENMILNIAMHGVLEPILVRKNGEAIEVIVGRGRTKAALEVNRRLRAEGKPTIFIPAMVKGGSDADLFGMVISENEIRRDDSMVNKGEKARKLLNMGHTVQQIAVTFGVTRQAVDSWLTVQQLPQQIKDAVESGELSATAALQLASAGHSREEQVERFEDLKRQGAKPTVKTVRSAASAKDNKPAPKMRSQKEVEAHRHVGRPTTSNMGDDYAIGFAEGYLAALRWVLNESDGGGNE
jgi:ParB family chromosome partitioning protein